MLIQLTQRSRKSESEATAARPEFSLNIDVENDLTTQLRAILKFYSLVPFV